MKANGCALKTPRKTQKVNFALKEKIQQVSMLTKKNSRLNVYSLG
jgi:hypothetical protein